MKSIIEKLEQNSKIYGDKTIFADEISSESYESFLDKTQKIASGLLKFNRQPIAVFDNRNVNTLACMFAVLASGNFYVVIDSKAPSDRVKKIYDILKPCTTILEEDNLSLYSELNLTAKSFLFDEIVKTLKNQEALDKRYAGLISTDPAYVLFTSGSTGMPKGTVISHQNILSYIEWFTSEFEINANTAFGNQTPFYFSMSVSDIFATVYSGATLNIIPKSSFVFPMKLINFLNERKVNTIYWVPSALNIVANFKLFNYAKPEHLKLVMFAGEIMQNKQLNYWRKNLPDAKFANLFGPTETTDICTFYKVNREFADSESLPIGSSCNNCDTFILDENGNEIKEANVVGELYARGPFLSYGYYNNKEKTDLAFVQNPLQNTYIETVYRTGDLVKINDYGEYEYVGRKDNQVKHMGYRIELGEIESAAYSIENLNSAVCIFDKEKDMIIMIYTGKVKPNFVCGLLSEKVPHYMIPNKVIKVSSLPLNQNGKVDRAWLKENYESLGE